MTTLKAAHPPAIQPRPKRTFYISLRVRLLVIFTLLFSLIFGAAYFWFYTYSTRTAQQRIQSELLGIVQGAVTQINGTDLINLATQGKPNADGFTSDDPRYKSLLAQLDVIHALEPQAWPYLYIKGDKDREYIIVVDLWQKYDTSHAANFLEHDTTSRVVPNIILGLTDFHLNNNDDGSFRVYTDKYGSWTSAYGPVKDANGNKVGALGVDFKADYVYQVQQGIINSTAIAFLLTYLVLFVSVFLISSALTRPIITLTRTARQIGKGDYTVDLTIFQENRLKDETVVLYEVFQVMVNNVRKREENLVQKVEQLQISIDTAKRQKEVSAIVETDFFKELQVKADKMRNRHSHPPEPSATLDAPTEQPGVTTLNGGTTT